VDAASSGDTVRVHAGSYPEVVRISGKNGLTIEGDPAGAPDAVSIQPTTQPTLSDCQLGIAAIQVDRSSGVTLRRLMVHSYEGFGVRLNDSSGAQIVGMRITGNGRPECGGGLDIAGNSSGTLVANNIIHANRRDGVVFSRISAFGAIAAEYLWSNTIYGNARHGVRVASTDQPLFWNNLIARNGSAPQPSFGILRDVTGIQLPFGSAMGLWHNLICGNWTSEVVPGPLEQPTAAGNLTPSGNEGQGYGASPGCDNPDTLFENRAAGRDEIWGTVDDDFFLRETSPAVDAGYSTLPSGLDPQILRGDFFENALVRPSDGNYDGTFTYDIGALEWGPRTRRNVPPHLSRVRRVPESIWLQP
jgi:hypothetical protein